MPHPPAAHDETVRMRPDEVDGRPAPDGSRPALVEERDDTRPVTRDWLLGGPERRSRPRRPRRPGTGPTRDADAGAGPSDRRRARCHRHRPRGRAVRAAVVRDTEPVDTAAAVDGGRRALEPQEGTAPDTPSGPPPGDEPPADGARGPWWRRGAVLVPTGAVAVLAALYGGDLLISSGDIPRATVVAGVEIGGLSPAAAASGWRRN